MGRSKRKPRKNRQEESENAKPDKEFVKRPKILESEAFEAYYKVNPTQLGPTHS